MMHRFTLLLILWLVSNLALGQELERRPLLGLLFETQTQKVGESMPSGAKVKLVIKKSSAAGANLLAGDIITSCNKVEIHSGSDLKKLISDQKVGDKISLKVFRDGKTLKKKMTLTEYPKETSEHYEVLHEVVTVESGLIRSVITKPHGEQVKMPAVFIVQGIGCFSIENNFFRRPQGIFPLIDSLTRNGFVTMRMERSGVGDSQCKPCQSIGFDEDLRNFKRGLKTLKSYDYIDTTKIIIVGLSMGGVMAPLLAEDENISAIVVYGTATRDWVSYELENTLRGALLEEVPYEDLSELMEKEAKRLHHFFIENKTVAEIKEIDLEMGEKCEQYPLKPEYFQEVAAVDFYNLWAGCEAQVLAIHGNSDFVSAAYDHQLIATMVNQSNPGMGMYKEFPEADHWMEKSDSEKESFLGNSDGINQALIAFISQWIQSKA